MPAPELSLPLKSRLLARLGVSIIQLFSSTLRWRYIDEGGVLKDMPQGPVVWVVWHNRIFALYQVYSRFLSSRDGAVLTSVSGDGDIIAAALKLYGVHPIRGSSSRRGTEALLTLSEWVRAGFDVLIVPDGPRGPCYRMGPGAVKLAELGEVPIVPIRVDYASSWRFNGWDQFRLPKPFSRVTVSIGPRLEIPHDLNSTDFECERIRVEQALNLGDDGD